MGLREGRKTCIVRPVMIAKPAMEDQTALFHRPRQASRSGTSVKTIAPKESIVGRALTEPPRSHGSTATPAARQIPNRAGARSAARLALVRRRKPEEAARIQWAVKSESAG